MTRRSSLYAARRAAGASGGAAAPPSFVGVGTAVNGVQTGDPTTPGLPAGVQPDDLLIFIIKGNAGPTAARAGWTALTAPSGGVSFVLWHRHVAGETAPTFTTGGSGQFGGRIMGIRGLLTSGSPQEAYANGQGDGGIGTSITFEAVSPSVARTAIVHFTSYSNTADTTGMSQAGTNAALRDLQSAFFGIGGTNPYGVWIGFKDTAGSTGNTVLTGLANAQHSQTTYALK